jgi:hypothetical protein
MARSTPWTGFTLLLLLSLAAATPLPAQEVKSGTTHIDSRVDLYAGYGYFHPIAGSAIDGYPYPSVYNPNANVSFATYFDRFFGLQVEGGYLSGKQNKPYSTCLAENCSQLVYTAEAGPIFRVPLGAFVPFIHFLGGGERHNGPSNQSLAWGYGLTAGAGLDIVLPPFHQRFAIRPIQADVQYSQVNHGTLSADGSMGGEGNLTNLKLSAGLVVRFGDFEPPFPVMLGCGAEPSDIYPGDPIAIHSNALHLNPKKNPTYKWESTGGKILPNGAEASIDTTGLAPGAYIAKGSVEEGPKPKQQATCTAPFTVKEFEPPVIACSANPSTAIAGTDIDITAKASSPQNRPLTYSYTTTSGVVNGAGPSAKLSTAGLSPSTVTVTCTVADDVNHTVNATAEVTLSAPPAPVIPQTQQLCSLSFGRDTKRPVRVDNEAKGCLDDIALTLNGQTSARLIIVGDAVPADKPNAAAERTLNARQYLVQEKGIDPSRIELRTGDTADKAVSDTLVPPGAIFNDLGTHTFDEKTIKRHGQAYGTPQTPRAAKVKAPAPATPQ